MYSNFLRLEFIKQGNKFYALAGWNGEKYYDCFEIDKYECPIKSNKKYTITPIYNFGNTFSEINEDNLELIGYDVKLNN